MAVWGCGSVVVWECGGSDSIKVLEIQVPPRVPTGETVRLGCLYDLEGANLYSLTWWRGTEQFYQFSPSSQEQMTVYDSPGITVDRNRSSRDEVVLRNVSHASAGRYKCEVLADFPSYEKDSQITSMEVIGELLYCVISKKKTMDKSPLAFEYCDSPRLMGVRTG
ncbi:uncharacterized protein LOC134763206 [Penaeus indicus]|uniref:uncharacterized protein LOC134763206 n=1 Tax=Penaeus indicus TaxID=29960 RepID=UPI00300D526D